MVNSAWQITHTSTTIIISKLKWGEASYTSKKMRTIKKLDNVFKIDASSTSYIKATVSNKELGIKVRCYYPVGVHHDSIIEHLEKAVMNIANLGR